MVTPNCVITDAGREIMRRITTSGLTVRSDSFVFTKVAFGNGTYTDEERTESYLRTATALKTQKNVYPVTSLKKVSARDPQNMLYRVSTIAYNYNVATETVLVPNGYYITEIGIYAKATGGTETLVAIALIGDTVDTSENDYMPGVDTEEEIEGQIYQIVYDLYFGYSNVELDATVESSGAAFPMEDGQALEAREDALEALIGTGNGIGSIVLGTDVFGTKNNNSANGYYSTAMGVETAANGTASSAMGNGTVANGNAQSVRGRYNVEDDGSIAPYGGLYLDIVGNGRSSSNRSNAYALTWDGDAHYALDTAAEAGTDDAQLYAAITALGWESEVIV